MSIEYRTYSSTIEIFRYSCYPYFPKKFGFLKQIFLFYKNILTNESGNFWDIR